MNNKLSFKKIIVAGLIAASVSAVINTVLFFIFQAAGVFTNDIMIQPNQPLSVVPVLISSIVPTLIAACIFFLFEKYGKNGYKTFSIVSIILLVLSFANPFFGIPNVTVPYAVALNLMHIVVAFSLLYFIKRAKNNLV
jgi:uncharacterized membrane protein